ncbi:hypothetical protein, partial [Escherichia coli]|uniref:hypothetical protein n=1 Tax=Escherichia coli TaxID=562 RepID=UPI0010ABA3D6
GFTALTERGVVPSWSLVRCDGGRNRTTLKMITIIIFCGSSWWGGYEHGAGGAEKGAFFDFYGTITTSVNH